MILAHNIDFKVSQKTKKTISVYFGRTIHNKEVVKISAYALIVKLGFVHIKDKVFSCCDKCGDFYIFVSANFKNDSHFFCGRCRRIEGQNRNALVNKTQESRDKKSASKKELSADPIRKAKYTAAISKSMTDFWQNSTDEYKEFRGELTSKAQKILWENASGEYRESHIARAKKHAVFRYGEDNPMFNPNKSEYDEYRRLVFVSTRSNNLTLLENSDKLRSIAGVDGGYQLDHIISCMFGYKNKIDPSIIGHICNLQFNPWKENLCKSSECGMTVLELLIKIARYEVNHVYKPVKGLNKTIVEYRHSKRFSSINNHII